MPPARVSALLVAALVVLPALATAGVAAQEDFVTITVAVTDTTGEPVRDARLTAAWDGGSSGMRSTASNGKAFLDVPDGADITIQVSHTDFTRNEPLVVEDASEREVPMTVYPKASATVTVEDRTGGVPDATVTLQKGGTQVVEATTGDDGVVESGTIEAGTYRIVVLKPGYFVERTDVELTGDAAVPITIRRGTATLEVNVTDDHFDPPVPVGEATVRIEGSGSVVTQPTGIGRLSVPVNAWASVEVAKEGYQTATDSIYVGESDASLALSVERTPDITLELLSSRVVIGERVALEVTDEYGEPVAGADVRLDGDLATETDADGRAVLTIESAGNHSVQVEQDGLSSESKTVVGVDTGGEDGATTTAASPDDTEAADGQPGFGLGVGLLAVVGAVLVALRSRRAAP